MELLTEVVVVDLHRNFSPVQMWHWKAWAERGVSEGDLLSSVNLSSVQVITAPVGFVRWHVASANIYQTGKDLQDWSRSLRFSSDCHWVFVKHLFILLRESFIFWESVSLSHLRNTVPSGPLTWKCSFNWGDGAEVEEPRWWSWDDRAKMMELRSWS